MWEPSVSLQSTALRSHLLFHNHFCICHLKINNSLLYTVALALKGHLSFTVISTEIMVGRSRHVQLYWLSVKSKQKCDRSKEKHCIASHVYQNGSCPKWARVNCKENYFPSSIHDKANVKDINLKKKVKVKHRCISC